MASLLTATICLSVVSLLALVGCAYFGMKASKVPSKETEMMKVAPEKAEAEGGEIESKRFELVQKSEQQTLKESIEN